MPIGRVLFIADLISENWAFQSFCFLALRGFALAIFA
jgi:hypothetical protein